MTRDEAINLLDNMLGMVEDNHGSDYDKAIHMAIDALKQSERITGRAVYQAGYADGYNSAQSERKTGKWIIEPYDAQNDIFIHRCGTCMRVAMLGGHTTKFKFCPLCGSAMTEGEQP